MRTAGIDSGVLFYDFIERGTFFLGTRVPNHVFQFVLMAKTDIAKGGNAP